MPNPDPKPSQKSDNAPVSQDSTPDTGKPILVHSSIAVSAQRTETVLISPYISPVDLAAYKKIDPELVKRLIEHNLASLAQAAEEEARDNEHRRQLEKKDQDGNIADRERSRQIESNGQRWAGVIAILGFLLCGFAIYFQQPTAASVLGCTMIVALVSAFIFGRFLNRTPTEQATPQPQADANETQQPLPPKS